MATPDDMAHVARRVRGIYADAEAAILQKMARTTARTGAPTGFQQSVLAERQRLGREVDQIIRDLENKVPGAVQEVVDLGYNRGVGSAASEASKAGIESAILAGSADTGSAVALARAATEPLGSMGYTIRRWTADIYDQVTQQAAGQVATGTLTRQEASQGLLQKLAKQGVTGFVDRTGRNWEMGSYAEMSTRTATAQAQLAGHTEKLSSLGVDTAMVSDSPEECELCRPWENRVVSISGSTTGRLSDGQTVAGSLAQARAAGVFHPGCTHSIGIYVPGVTKARAQSRTANPEGGAMREKQRAYERRVRELKRESIIADEFGGAGKTRARSRLREKQAEFKSWRDANDRKNLAYRTSLKAR